MSGEECLSSILIPRKRIHSKRGKGSTQRVGGWIGELVIKGILLVIKYKGYYCILIVTR